jgi:hypothetical protein
VQSIVAANFKRVFEKSLRVLLWIGIFAYFAYLLYLVIDWLIFGAGIGLLLLGVFVGVIYVVFGWLPETLSKRTRQSKWQADRTIRLFLLFAGGLLLGAYWIPKQFNFTVAWYWRVLLGVAVAVVGLMTRRYP